MAYTATLIPGDGIGPEVSEAVVRIFKVAGLDVQWDRHDAGVIAFKSFLGIAGPVAAGFVIGEHNAMAGVADVDGENLAIEGRDLEHGQFVIDRPAFCAAVD